jgi:feruloyl esterase
VANPEACRFDPQTLGPQGSGFLSASQVTALKNVFGGARDLKGRALYAGWFWDPGIAAAGWRIWKIGPLFPGPGNTSLNTTLGGSALPFVFITPPMRRPPAHPATRARSSRRPARCRAFRASTTRSCRGC